MLILTRSKLNKLCNLFNLNKSALFINLLNILYLNLNINLKYFCKNFKLFIFLCKLLTLNFCDIAYMKVISQKFKIINFFYFMILKILGYVILNYFDNFLLLCDNLNYLFINLGLHNHRYLLFLNNFFFKIIQGSLFFDSVSFYFFTFYELSYITDFISIVWNKKKIAFSWNFFNRIMKNQDSLLLKYNFFLSKFFIINKLTLSILFKALFLIMPCFDSKFKFLLIFIYKNCKGLPLQFLLLIINFLHKFVRFNLSIFTYVKIITLIINLSKKKLSSEKLLDIFFKIPSIFFSNWNSFSKVIIFFKKYIIPRYIYIFSKNYLSSFIRGNFRCNNFVLNFWRKFLENFNFSKVQFKKSILIRKFFLKDFFSFNIFYWVIKLRYWLNFLKFSLKYDLKKKKSNKFFFRYIYFLCYFLKFLKPLFFFLKLRKKMIFLLKKSCIFLKKRLITTSNLKSIAEFKKINLVKFSRKFINKLIRLGKYKSNFTHVHDELFPKFEQSFRKASMKFLKKIYFYFRIYSKQTSINFFLFKNKIRKQLKNFSRIFNKSSLKKTRLKNLNFCKFNKMTTLSNLLNFWFFLYFNNLQQLVQKKFFCIWLNFFYQNFDILCFNRISNEIFFSYSLKNFTDLNFLRFTTRNGLFGFRWSRIKVNAFWLRKYKGIILYNKLAFLHSKFIKKSKYFGSYIKNWPLSLGKAFIMCCKLGYVKYNSNFVKRIRKNKKE